MSHIQEIVKLSANDKDFYEERAAIMQYDGGLTREQAEIAALSRVPVL